MQREIWSRQRPQTAGPTSSADAAASSAERLISNLAIKVRQEPANTEFTIYSEQANPRKFFVFEQYVDEAGFEAHIGAEYGVIFNQQLSSLIEEGASQLTFLTRSDPP